MTYSTAIPAKAMLPTSLTVLDQWVAWRPVPDKRKPDAKPKKLPIDSATERAASTTDPATWGTFDEVAGWASQRRVIAGIGFVFVAGQGITGIDFDGCRDPETGALFGWQGPWVERFRPLSYAEVSPSETGVKCWVRAHIGGAVTNKAEGVEIYDQERYFTVTGRRLAGCADEPQEAQALVDELVAYVRSLSQPDEPELPAPVAEPERTPQEPVAAPAEIPGWRGDRQQGIAALVRTWVDDKIDRARAQMAAAGEGTRHNRRLQLGELLGGVIATVPGLLTEADAVSIIYNGKKPESHQGDELKAILAAVRHGQQESLAHDLPRFPTDEPPLLVDGRAWCPACRAALRRSSWEYAPGMGPGWYCPQCKGPMRWPLSAWGGAGLAGAESAPVTVPVTAGPEQATELPLLIRASDLHKLPPGVPLIPEILYVNKLHLLFGAPGVGKSLIAFDLAATIAQLYTVIYVAAEAVEDFEDRREAWEALHGVSTENLWFWRESIKFALPGEVDKFIAPITPLRPALIIIDPLANNMSGLVETTQEGMMVAIDAVERIRRATGAGILLLHHTGWSEDRERGSSTLRGAARVVIKVDRKEDGTIQFACVKKNQGAPFATRFLRLVPAGERGSVAPLPASRVERDTKKIPEKLYLIFEALTKEQYVEGATHGNLTEYTTYPKATVTNLLDIGVRGGYLRSIPKGNSKLYSLTDDGRRKLESHQEQAAQPASAGRQTPRAGRFSWEVCGPDVTGLDAVGAIDPDAPPTQAPSAYAAPDGYDAYIDADLTPPPPDDDEAPPAADEPAGYGELPPWDAVPDAGPSRAMGVYERLRRRQQEGVTHAAD
jgi:hypothetical protein